MSTNEETMSFAVALFPTICPNSGQTGAREVRVMVCALFGPNVAEAIGAEVREVNANGVPLLGADRRHILAIQRLVFAKVGDDGRRVVPARELAEKRMAYVARLAAEPFAGAVTAPRRKPRLHWQDRTEARVEEEAAA